MFIHVPQIPMIDWFFGSQKVTYHSYYSHCVSYSEVLYGTIVLYLFFEACYTGDGLQALTWKALPAAVRTSSSFSHSPRTGVFQTAHLQKVRGLKCEWWSTHPKKEIMGSSLTMINHDNQNHFHIICLGGWFFDIRFAVTSSRYPGTSGIKIIFHEKKNGWIASYTIASE